MAFATSNVQAANLGSIRAFVGDWSGAVGDASGTVTLNGGRVYLCRFENQDADSPNEDIRADISVSSGTITVTVHNHLNVTNGRFIIIYA